MSEEFDHLSIKDRSCKFGPYIKDEDLNAHPDYLEFHAGRARGWAEKSEIGSSSRARHVADAVWCESIADRKRGEED